MKLRRLNDVQKKRGCERTKNNASMRSDSYYHDLIWKKRFLSMSHMCVKCMDLSMITNMLDADGDGSVLDDVLERFIK